MVKWFQIIQLDTSDENSLRRPDFVRRPKKQSGVVAVTLWKLTGKRKVIGRNFGEITLMWRLRGDNQLAKGQRNMQHRLW